MALGEMREAGVDAAVLTSLGIYGDEMEVELEGVRQHPDQFRAVGVADPIDPHLAGKMSSLKDQGMIGIRVPELRRADRVRSGEFERVLQLCDDLHLCVMLPAFNAALGELFARYPNIFFCLNHLGLGSAPPIVGYRDIKPFANLADVCSLAKHPNVGLKLTGTPALSRETYPFRDIWGVVHTVIKAFGADRIFWGSDYTRTAGLYSYAESTNYLREIDGLAQDDLVMLYGEALAMRMGWDSYNLERKE